MLGIMSQDDDWLKRTDILFFNPCSIFIKHKNKDIVTNRFLALLEASLKKPKKRVPTKVSRTEKARRIEAKKKRGQKKSLRQKPKWD